MYKVSWLFLIILVNIIVYSSTGYKILVAFPVPSKSHAILGEGMVRHLLEAGHEVTYITPHPKKTAPPNLRQIDASAILQNMTGNPVSLKTLLRKEVDLRDTSFFHKILEKMNNAIFTNKNILKLLNDPNEQFDLFLGEWFFTELLSGFAAVFQCPYIWVSTVEPHWQITRFIDESLNPSYNSDILSTNSVPLSFYERVEELITQVKLTAMEKMYLNEKDEKTYTDIIGPLVAARGRTLPPYSDLIYNVSLILGNSHVSMGEATRLPQNYKPVGGYHIDANLTPLPEDLKKLLNEAKNGVIYFSMGSSLKSVDMPDDFKTGLLKLFGELKQTVIWKFEESLTNVPSNVHLVQWAPQQSILAHSNCILFITHGGLLSTTETIHFGKPIIGIPGFGDQFINVNRMVKKGFGVKVDLTFSLVEDLKLAIAEILSNPRYTKKVRELSLIYHDRPVPPGKELVHWVEHVIRTGGAPHLRSPALHVPFWQKLYLDLLVVIIVVLYATKILLSRLFRLIFGKGQLNKKKYQ
ncbi:UDP-glycosyltransferase UGT5-like [Achroia grisella]|uniref:UDP-glycosyltransferase UGT5-like n=1 Tax=Achroia grisella TaxID=688607 RepID=UPI0027D1EC90|nr:UDP-glycosyltransferase UGT5-like [Achroia grisella]